MVHQEHGLMQAEHGWRTGWLRFCHNPHVKAEFSALMYLVAAVIAVSLGLFIAPLVCATIALCVLGCDLYSCVHKEDRKKR